MHALTVCTEFEYNLCMCMLACMRWENREMCTEFSYTVMQWMFDRPFVHRFPAVTIKCIRSTLYRRVALVLTAVVVAAGVHGQMLIHD